MDYSSPSWEKVWVKTSEIFQTFSLRASAHSIEVFRGRNKLEKNNCQLSATRNEFGESIFTWQLIIVLSAVETFVRPNIFCLNFSNFLIVENCRMRRTEELEEFLLRRIDYFAPTSWRFIVNNANYFGTFCVTKFEHCSRWRFLADFIASSTNRRKQQAANFK